MLPGGRPPKGGNVLPVYFSVTVFQSKCLAIHYNGKLYLRADNILTRRLLMLIKNGLIINPAAEESYKADLLIKDGIIMDIKENIVSF